MDLFAKCHDFTEARQAKAAGIYPYFVPFVDNDGTTARLDGREIIMAGSNNYLGLTKDPRVLAAARTALDASGSSVTGSRLLNGNLLLHEELEAELAAFFGKPAALVFSTGYGTNVGTIAALVSRGDEIYLDREAHASAIDGARMSQAPIRVFEHNSAADLRRKLAKRSAVGRLVVVDGVYSMGGDLCPLPEILEVCEDFGARVLVDDAHGVGVRRPGTRDLRPLRGDGPGRPDHADLQQGVGVDRRRGRRRRGDHPLPAAPRPGRDLLARA